MKIHTIPDIKVSAWFLKILLLAVITLCQFPTYSKDFGTEGILYPVKEQDLKTTIINELTKAKKDGRLDKFNKEMLTKAKKRIIRPKVVNHLVPATEYKTFLVDMTKPLLQDIYYNGRIRFKKGTLINPLDYRPYTHHLVFINGDRKSEVKYALDYIKAHKLTKIILVSGSPTDLNLKYKKSFKFAQSTEIIRSFNLSVTPSVVYQEGNKMRVEEIPL